MLESTPCTGVDSSMSNAFPLVGPSTWGMSTRTTSPSSFCASIKAVVAPVKPAPMTEIFLLRMVTSTFLLFGVPCDESGWISCLARVTSPLPSRRKLREREEAGLIFRSQIFDQLVPELRALHLGGPFHQPGEVVGDGLLADCLVHRGVDQVRRLLPAQIFQHQHAGQNDRTRVHLVQTGIFGGGAVGRFKNGVPGVVVDVGSGSDSDAAHLGRQGVGNVVPVQVE